MNRIEKTLSHVNRNGYGLEIGPSHNPIASKRAGFNVEILDHASAEELREKYRAHPVNIDNIEEVDYVWRGESLDRLIGKSEAYDYIIASHVVEHVTDLVAFLQQCENLLNAGGVLSLVIPDKRYCFDYFRWPSSTGEALQAYTERRTRHTPGTVFDHFSNASKMDDAPAWGQQMRGKMSFIHSLEEARSAWMLAQKNDEYIDAHSWRFTPSSFRLILNDLQELKLINLVEIGSFDTEGCEFFIALGKRGASSLKYDRLQLAQSMIREIADGARTLL